MLRTASGLSTEACLYLQIRLSSDLILKLAVRPLQDIYSRLADVDPQGWWMLTDITTDISVFFFSFFLNTLLGGSLFH